MSKTGLLGCIAAAALIAATVTGTAWQPRRAAVAVAPAPASPAVPMPALAEPAAPAPQPTSAVQPLPLPVPSAAEAPFVAVDCRPRLFEDRPALAVTFSRPIEAVQNFAALAQVLDLGAPGDAAAVAKPVPGAWVVEANQQVLVFPYVAAQRRLRIDLKPGLASMQGQPLAEPKSCEVTSDGLPPSFQFASRGIVLPAQQNGGLPIVTVNVPRVDVQFLEVLPEALPQFFESVASRRAPRRDDDGGEEDYGYEPRQRGLQGAISGYTLDGLKSITRSVFLGRFQTTAAPNQRGVTFLPVESIAPLQKPGVYVAVMSEPGRFGADYQTTYFYVSDIGVHVRRYARTLDAFATSLRSGEALAATRFELLDERAQLLAQAAGDDEGHAHFAALPPAARLLLARRGAPGQEQTSVIVLGDPALDLSEFDVNGLPPRDIALYAYAGRDLYRPGESFTLSVLVRDLDGKPLAPTPVAATLKRPDGRSVGTATLRPDAALPGYLQHRVQLAADAPTGSWLLELRADPAAAKPAAVWKFQVEEFLPERMKLGLQSAPGPLQRGDAFRVEVRGDYLYGAPAVGNRLLVAAATERQVYALPQQWPGFVFGDFADDDAKQRQQLDERTLDDAGRAAVELALTSARPPRSPMLVRGSFSLLESAGRPVVRSIERSVWPAPVLLALRPLFDRDVASENGRAGFELIRVDAQGRPQPLKQVPLRLVREEREYYWRYDDRRSWHSGYIERDVPIDTLQVPLAAQRSRFDLPVEWGRYRVEIDDPETGQQLRYRFHAGWGSQDAESIGLRPDRVQLQLANVPVAAGTAPPQLTIRPPHDGTALVTLEGDRLLWSRRIAVQASGTTLEIPVDPAWARHDLYVTVAAFRPGSQGERVTPARAIGLAHLPLARVQRKLAVAIQAPAQVLPERQARVKVQVDGLAGQDAMVTLSAVDVGILNVTRYASPDAHAYFFGKQRYGGELLDLYGKLIEKMAGKRGKLAYGGDAASRDTRSLPRKVQLVDLFSGPLRVDARGVAEVPLDIPDFNGTLRLMATAATADRYGSAEAELVAAAPVVAELSLPRFVTPGDSAAIALDVTNLSGAAQSLEVRLAGAALLRVAEGGERKLRLKDKERATLHYTVEATDAEGLGRLELRVNGANGLRIVRTAALQVQPAAPREREARYARLEPGASLTLEPAALERYYAGSARLALAVSDRPPLNVSQLVQGLLDYPYGCAEQTTSAAYPHLYIDEAAAAAYGLKPRSRAERAAFVDGAVARLAGMQLASGGYTLWGYGDYEAWLSAYVVGFLQDARDQGFPVPEAMLRSSSNGLLLQVQSAPAQFAGLPGAEREQHRRFAALAHAGYVLARDRLAPLAVLRQLHDQQRDRARSPLPLVHLALALKLMGDEARAAVALDEAMSRPYGLPGRRDGGWDEWLGDYGTLLRDRALSYALLHRHGVAHPRREQLLFDLADGLKARGRAYYHSTQERLALFLAARAAQADASASWRAELRSGAASRGLAGGAAASVSLDAAALAGGATLTNRGTQALFVESVAEGYPRVQPAPRSDAIRLQRDWYDSSGQPLRGRTRFETGELLIVRVLASASEPIEDGLVVDRVPAGFEIENLDLAHGAEARDLRIDGADIASHLADPRIRHTEFRDDRFVAAARLEPGTLAVYYLVRAVTPGRYVVPPPQAEAMYRPNLNGLGEAAAPITVVDPRARPAVAASAPR